MSQQQEAFGLCRQLLEADTEKAVIGVLTHAGYWDRPELWRFYGDVENNWAQSGNQQSLAEAALAEKLVNAVDARLMGECLARGIDPASEDAPRAIRQAVARFFEGSAADKLATGGYVEDWGDAKKRSVAEGITLCATGTRPDTLSLTISDCGEGQTPRRLPETILSLNKSNKMYIRFVQGQFNQGGTGALRFCGEHNLQLVISRRNPVMLQGGADENDAEWGFTIVRRERPLDGKRRNSVYTYLAPCGIGAGKDDHYGEILSFKAQKLAIFPDKEAPYARAAGFGTCIKLYEYQYIGEKSNILRGKSLLSRLDLLLPEIALPVRMYDFRRDKRGNLHAPGSRETTLFGLRRRLLDNENVEDGFPLVIPFCPHGQKLVAHAFAFKPTGSLRDGDEEEADGESRTKKKLGGLRGYRKREGIVFVRNGQTQGSLPKDFFRRDSLKMKPLADDLLVFVDCDELSDAVREDLFMPSRDRLADIQFRHELVNALEQALRTAESLKNLRNRRQQEKMAERLKDDRPLTDVLQTLIKSSPNLTSLLELGQRIPSPFSTKPTGGDEITPFVGEVYPSYFKTKGVQYGTPYRRSCPINQRMRLTFETDARDDYFTRRIERGQFYLTWRDGDGNQRDSSYVGPTLKSGLASVMLNLPDEAEVGQEIEFTATVTDSRATFENRIWASVKEETHAPSGGSGRRKNPAQREGREREKSTELAPPHIERVYKEQWEENGFDEHTAMRIDLITYAGEDDSTEVYAFKVNMDNTPLLNEIKLKRLDDEPARNQFLYANVLIGLSLLLDHKQRSDSRRLNGGDEQAVIPIEERVEMTCRALAPFLLALTSLASQDLTELEQIDGLEEAG